MKKLYYLSTCSTCKNILKGLGEKIEEFELVDIKSNPLDENQLEELKGLVDESQTEELEGLMGAYETLFSKSARKYQDLGLKEKNLEEADFRHYLLEHYTFLKRPVLIDSKEIFIGSKAVQTYIDAKI